MDYSILYWWSDWNGEDVGYDDIDIVGLYSIKDFPMIYLYIDIENEKILEVWLDNN